MGFVLAQGNLPNFDFSWTIDGPLIIGGLAKGAIYAIVALGIVLVLKSTSVLNLAVGFFIMLGAYMSVSFLVVNHIGFVPALIVITLAMAILGLIIHYGVMRFLVGRPFFTISLVTIGLSLIMKAGILIKYGPVEQPKLDALPKSSFKIGDANIRWSEIIVLAIVAGVLIAFLLFFRFTRLGLHMRAVADNLEAAAAQGINPDRVYAITWALSLALAGLGGLLLGHVNATISQDTAGIGLASFPAAVIGGVTSLGGAIVGGLIVGVLENLTSGHIGDEWSQTATFLLLFIILLVKPSGLFGKKQLERV